MEYLEYHARAVSLEQKIEFNKRIRCTLVAARYERQLEALKKEYKKSLEKSNS